MNTTTKLLSVSKARDPIQAICQIPVEKVNIDFLKSQLLPLIMGHTILTPLLSLGTKLYRARVFDSNARPKGKSELSYPPSQLITKDQRAGRAGQTRLYTSTSYTGAILEVKPPPGSYVAVSSWITMKNILLANVGYTSKVLESYNSNRKLPSWCRPSVITNKPTNRLIYRFFGDIFTQESTDGHEYHYKMSAAISECMLGGDVTEGDSEFLGTQVGGLIYPTLAMKANADNIVFIPSLIDNKDLEICEVDLIYIGKNGTQIKLDRATSFKENGQIEWQSQIPDIYE